MASCIIRPTHYGPGSYRGLQEEQGVKNLKLGSGNTQALLPSFAVHARSYRQADNLTSQTRDTGNTQAPLPSFAVHVVKLNKLQTGHRLDRLETAVYRSIKPNVGDVVRHKQWQMFNCLSTCQIVSVFVATSMHSK